MCGKLHSCSTLSSLRICFLIAGFTSKWISFLAMIHLVGMWRTASIHRYDCLIIDGYAKTWSQTFHYDSAITATQFAQLFQILVAEFTNFLLLIQKQFDSIPRFVVHFQFFQSVRQCFDAGFRFKQSRSTEMLNGKWNQWKFVALDCDETYSVPDGVFWNGGVGTTDWGMGSTEPGGSVRFNLFFDILLILYRNRFCLTNWMQ